MSGHPEGSSPAVSPAESIEEAIASTRLEGLELPPELLRDAEAVAAGEMSTDELVARTLARHRR